MSQTTGYSTAPTVCLNCLSQDGLQLEFPGIMRALEPQLILRGTNFPDAQYMWLTDDKGNDPHRSILKHYHRSKR